MQELKTIGAPQASSRGTVAGCSFDVLFTLVGSDSMDARSLADRVGITQSECLRIIEDLHRRYLLDVVSNLDGDTVKETLRLTEEGEAALLHSLEQMCELPELPEG